LEAPTPIDLNAYQSKVAKFAKGNANIYSSCMENIGIHSKVITEFKWNNTAYARFFTFQLSLNF